MKIDYKEDQRRTKDAFRPKLTTGYRFNDYRNRAARRASRNRYEKVVLHDSNVRYGRENRQTMYAVQADNQPQQDPKPQS